MVYIIHIYIERSSSFPQGRKARRGSNDSVSCRPMQETPTRQIQKAMAADMAVLRRRRSYASDYAVFEKPRQTDYCIYDSFDSIFR